MKDEKLSDNMPVSVDVVPTEEQAPTGASTTSLNLKYLVPEKERSRFSWQPVILVTIGLILVGLLGWLAYRSKSEIVVAHTVRANETIKSLAIKYYDDPRAWDKIFKANRDKLFRQQKLMVGQKLRIPLSRARFEELKNKLQK